MEIYYLCDKTSKEIISIGPIPDTWRDISGLSSCAYPVVSELTWAGYPRMGFLNEADALQIGVNPHIINANKLKSVDVQWEVIRSQRAAMIQAVRWRIERNQDELAMGRTPTEDVTPILDYIQKLRDLPDTETDPFNITWPSL
jgi:hypothetical protein